MQLFYNNDLGLKYRVTSKPCKMKYERQKVKIKFKVKPCDNSTDTRQF